MFSIRIVIQVVLLLAQGVFEVLRSAQNFEALEVKVQQLIQRAALTLLKEALNQIDRTLCAERDTQELKVIGFRSRTIVTSFGELGFKRRLYLDQRTGEYQFLLDEALGLEARRRLSPRMAKLILELGTEVPFRRAARVLNFLVPDLSVMTVWSEAQRAGKEAAEEAAQLREAVFTHGAELPGKKRLSRLNVEADGVAVKLQRTATKTGEVKLVVGYEGKTGKPKRLVNRQAVAALVDSDAIWEEASVRFGSEWALGEVEKVRLGGDGAEWIKEGGRAYFPQATYHLDQFHLRRRLTEALSFSTGCYEAVADRIAALDREAVLLALARALKQAPGRPARKRVRELQEYLLNNWEGIVALPEDERLGAIEGEVRHIITRRMKRIGARWTVRGGDHMARLLSSRANGKLGSYIGSAKLFNREVLKQAVGQEVVKRPKAKGEDPSEWLKAGVPALNGPSADTPFVKYVLRELVSVRWSL